MHSKSLAITSSAVLLAAISLTGCTATQLRTGGDVVGAAGGGIIANKLSHGNPWITAAGAGGGALIADVAGSQIERAQNSAEKRGTSVARATQPSSSTGRSRRFRSARTARTRARPLSTTSPCRNHRAGSAPRASDSDAAHRRVTLFLLPPPNHSPTRPLFHPP